MPVSKKPKKKHKQRITYDPSKHLARLSPEEVLAFQAMNHSALEAILKGKGTQGDWARVTNTLNLALVLDENLYGFTCRDSIIEAMKAHAHCCRRHWETGAFGYAGPELQTVYLSFEIHDEQMTQVTGRELDIAMRETVKRVKHSTPHPTVQKFTKQLAEGQVI